MTNDETPRSRPTDPLPENVHTAYDWNEGGIKTYVNFIDPPGIRPAKGGVRFKLDNWLLGRLESLARSRFHIAEVISDQDLAVWRSRKQESYAALVQTVMASSAIEGESVYVEAEIQGGVEPHESDSKESPEQANRRLIGGDIYDAYIFALNHRPDPVLSVEFIKDLHNRMFHRIYPDTSGKLKSHPVRITGGGYSIETVPSERTLEFLESIVSQLNERWRMSVLHAEYSLFLIISEFIVDFLAVHPFSDGNGRTARLLSTYLLERAGYHFARFYSLDNIIHETRMEYYKALFAAQTGWYTKGEDLGPWIDYYVNAVYTQYRRALELLKDEAVRKRRS